MMMLSDIREMAWYYFALQQFASYFIEVTLHPMFLERYRHSHERNLSAPMKVPNLIQVLKNSSNCEIKRHEKKSHYFNPRTYLIENAKKVIKTMKKDTGASPLVKPQKNQKIVAKNPYHLPSNHTESHITNRQARKSAIRNIHQRIWKSYDMSHLLRGQQERYLWHSKTSPKRDNKDITDGNLQRIEPYTNFIEEFDLSHNYRKGAIKIDCLPTTNRYSQNMRNDSRNKNPEHMFIGSVFLKDSPEESCVIGNNQFLISERRKQYNRASYQHPRPSTTSGYKHQRSDDMDHNIIDPW